MIQDKRNNGTGYEEKFDVARFEFIAAAVKSGKGTTGLSDIECYLHSIMKDLFESHMEMNHIWHFVYYEARHPIGSGQLALTCDTSNLWEVKKEIDESEKRAVNKGYNPTQYVIVKVEGDTIMDYAGRFIKKVTVETAVEYYPRGNA